MQNYITQVAIIDPGFVIHFGHHLNTNYFLASEFEGRNIPCTIHTSKILTHEIDVFLKVERTLAVDFYADFTTYKKLQNIERYVGISSQTFNSLLSLNESLASCNSLHILHTVNPGSILGTAYWLSTLAEGNRPFVVVILADSHALNSSDLVGDESLYYQHAVYKLLGSGGRVYLGVLPGAHKVFESTLGFQIDEVPYIIPGPKEFQSLNHGESEIPTIAFLGHSKVERGFLLIPDIVKKCLADWNYIMIIVQMTDPSFSGNSQELKQAGEELKELIDFRLHLLEGGMSISDYYETLSSADILVLPYNPCTYNVPSSVLNESIAFGKIIVHHRDTVHESQVSELQPAIVFFDSFCSDSVARAIDQVLQNYDSLHHKAREASQKWWKRHGTTNFVNFILNKISLLEE